MAEDEEVGADVSQPKCWIEGPYRRR